MTAIDVTRTHESTDDLLMAGNAAWETVDAVGIELAPTPLESQPSAYVQTSWREKDRGDIGEVAVKALMTDDALAIQLTWPQSKPARSIDDYNVYADACAVLFPANGGDPDVETMGSPEAPVRGWYWRAGTPEAFEITAEGIGTVERADEHDVRAVGWWSDDNWHVVLARSLEAPSGPAMDVRELPVAFAVWAGSREERAGLKSHSPQFHQLRLGT